MNFQFLQIINSILRTCSILKPQEPMHYMSHLQNSENQTSSQKADHRTGVIADLRLQSSQKKNLMAGVFP